MKLLTETAGSMRALVDFVNAHGIQKENIVEMTEMKDGTFILLYFGE